jgi:hypothetical protein
MTPESKRKNMESVNKLWIAIRLLATGALKLERGQ